MTFEEYLTKRRVNVAAFAAAEPQRFAEWQNWFGQMHPESFYMFVKMVLNDVRRNYWLAEVSKPVVAAETAENQTATPARPAGRRAPVSRPAAAATETIKSEIPAKALETEIAKPLTEIPETKADEDTAAPKPARPVFKPRGVIKKTTAEENKPASEVPEGDKSAENTAKGTPIESINPEAEKTATETSEIPATKPARPRAVIKRPSALNKPEPKPEETLEKTVGSSAEKVEEIKSESSETLLNSAENSEIEKTAETPKSPRPRPVFKRPAAASTSEITVSETEKTVGETPQKPEELSGENEQTENPVAKPGQEGASEAKAVSEEIQQSPEAAKAAEEVAAEAGHVPKPPRPRPVFKRPAAAKLPENVVEAEQKESETKLKPEVNIAESQPEESAENHSETVGDSTEKVEEPVPKPPRPRPIFKRPAKPESDSENQ